MKGIDLKNLNAEQKAKLEEIRGKRYTKATLEYKKTQKKEDIVVNRLVRHMIKNNIEGEVINNNGNISIRKRIK